MIRQIPNDPVPICLVGEAPGEKEAALGKPFVGPSGQLLTRMCRAAGINRDRCYITNVVHERPKKNDFSTLPKHVIEEGVERLKKDLLEWKPNVVIAVGKQALKALTGLEKITAARGAVTMSTLVPGLKVVPTLHPANLLRGNMHMVPIVVLDLTKAVAESKSPEFHGTQRDWSLVSSLVELEALVEDLITSGKPIVVDIETANTVLTAFGIATSPTTSYVVPNYLIKNPRTLVLLDRLMRSEDVPKIFHNALYDVLWLGLHLKILTRNIHFDTMIAQHVCYPIYPKSLAFCASIYTNEIYWKEMASHKAGHHIDWDTLYHYNALDTMLTYEIYIRLKQEIVSLGLEQVFQFDMDMIEPCLFAMTRGVRIDKEKMDRFKDSNESVVQKLEYLKSLVIGDVNINSPKQLKELFYGKWGFKPIKNKGRISTDQRALQKLEALPTPQQPIFGLIRTMRDYYKRRSFYKFKLDKDGRVRTAYKITGTISGRLSSTEGITGSGTNLQNIPKPVREIFVPDHGKIFVQADLSQAEARIVAALCGDREWLHQFDVDDVHWWVAEQVFGLPRSQMKKSVHRQMAKRISHASHYLMSWSLLKEILRVPAKRAKELIARYYEARPNLRLWQEEVRRIITKKKEIRTPFGRRLIFPTTITDADWRQAVSFVPQSTCAYINNRIWQRAYKELRYADILLQVHDSLLFQVPDDQEMVHRLIEDVRRIAAEPITIKSLVTGETIELVIPEDFEVGYNWYAMEEVKEG